MSTSLLQEFLSLCMFHLIGVQSFLGLKFFCLWTTLSSLQNFQRLESPKSELFSAYPSGAAD
jgi:hypothetical protein